MRTEHPRAGVERHRLVLVDDSPDSLELLELAFERTGRFTVVGTAANGREAVDVVTLHLPEVVLLDIAMPVMDGLEALPLIREAAPAATVVMLTSFGTSEMTQRATALGAHGFVQKGLSLSSLVETVEDLVHLAPYAGKPNPA